MNNLRLTGTGNFQQQGSTLIVSMFILLILTILGLTTMNTVTMEERMSGNFHDHNRAFQAAEAGLRDAENWILPQTQVIDDTTDGSSGVYEDGIFANIEDKDATWWATNGVEYGTTNSNELGNYADPYYLIEKTGDIKDSLDPTGTTFTTYYRVTSRGVGGSDTAVSVLQTSFAKRFN